MKKEITCPECDSLEVEDNPDLDESEYICKACGKLFDEGDE